MLTLLFWIVLRLLFDPRLDVLTVELPAPMPNSVVVFAWPTTFKFLIVSLEAPSVPLLCSQITAPVVDVDESVIVRLRSVPVPLIEPSIVTRSAAFSRMNPLTGAVVLVMDRAAPVG